MPTGPRGEKRPADVIGAAIMVARIATGEPRKAIASELRISEKTLGTHTERMYLRLKIHSQGLAVRMACAAGLV